MHKITYPALFTAVVKRRKMDLAGQPLDTAGSGQKVRGVQVLLKVSLL